MKVVVFCPNLIGAKKHDEAITFLNKYASAHPTSPELWRVYAAAPPTSWLLRLGSLLQR